MIVLRIEGNADTSARLQGELAPYKVGKIGDGSLSFYNDVL
jgi:hypothetical protein